MSVKVKPLLACEVDPDKVNYPILVSVKLDGIRALVIDEVVYSRSLKPIRNKLVQRLFGKPKFNGLDGELVVGDIYAKDVFQKTTSGVMSEDAEEDVKFYVFDRWDMPDVAYEDRVKTLAEKTLTTAPILMLRQVLVNSAEELQELLDIEKLNGGEGLIGRNPKGRYKYGRSTPKEQLSVKFKFFEQDEFEVVGFEERMHNNNEATTNELGYTERSSCKENLIPMDTLGSLVLRYGDSSFKVGTGFSDEQRQEIWDNKESYLGKLASIRYMSVGQAILPRCPSFIGWRDEDDL